MSKSLITLLSAGALALGVAACGGSSNSSSSASGGGGGSTAASSSTAATSSAATSSAAAPAAGASSKLALAANPGGALKFDKKTLAAKAGNVSITFTNSSSLGHNLTIQQGTSGSVVGATPTFTGGSKTLTVKLKPGTYTFFCSVPGHRMAGMQGTLTVS